MKRLIITRILTLNFIIPRDFWKMKYKALAIKKPSFFKVLLIGQGSEQIVLYNMDSLVFQLQNLPRYDHKTPYKKKLFWSL